MAQMATILFTEFNPETSQLPLCGENIKAGEFVEMDMVMNKVMSHKQLSRGNRLLGTIMVDSNIGDPALIASQVSRDGIVERVWVIQ